MGRRLLIVSTWLWGTKYGPEYVERLRAGVARHLKQRHEFRVFTPNPIDKHLTEVPGCFARLRMFDPLWQVANGIGPEDRLACLDLDLIITGPLDPLFDRDESFLILYGANAANPCPFNGSVMMLQAREHASVWHDFSIEAARTVPFYEFPDDQGWLAHKLPNAAGWKCGPASGVWAFRKCGWPNDDHLPRGARIVAFPGKRDPSEFTYLGWVEEHWIA